ncbi:MAG: enoyl-CoA hydratase [Alphaproteobacteria bacterium]
MADFETIRYEEPAPGVARIVLARPDARNAQDLTMTYEIDAAFTRAGADDGIKCVILAGDDPHFSAGHDLRGKSGKTMDDFDQIGQWGAFDAGGAEGRLSREMEVYLGVSKRWRDFPKPTIAAVQGKCIAGGLMLAWVCDLILASDDAQFRDPVIDLGVCGVEWFAHPWELGWRKAKELLFTADWFSAEDAKQFGMVNQVIPRAELADKAVELASRIAAKPAFALKATKLAVNQMQDAAGFQNGMNTVFAWHQLCHAHNMQMFNLAVDPSGLAPSVKGRTDARLNAKE